jgi:hypothetical protein
MNPIIECELIRRQQWVGILDWVKSLRLLPNHKCKLDLSHLLLRYILNKVITRQTTDDPVFITSPSTLATQQIQLDWKYSKITALSASSFINQLEHKIKTSALLIKNAQFKFTLGSVTMPTSSDPTDIQITDDKLNYIYNKNLYPILGQETVNDHTVFRIALWIRYDYLNLSTHGLARIYKHWLKPEDATEAFASGFNHYCHNFCSAFPDLELPLGSMGSFFNPERPKWTTPLVMINPPFDESLIEEAVTRFIQDCQSEDELGECRNYLFTLPNWTDMSALGRLRALPWFDSEHIYRKGELPFINHMNGKIIYPCDICEIKLSTKLKSK